MTELEILATRFDEHVIANEKDINCFNGKLTSIKKKIKNIDKIETDVSWVKKIQWFIVTTLVTNLIGTVILLVNIIIS
jgi:hypothetical protein